MKNQFLLIAVISAFAITSCSKQSDNPSETNNKAKKYAVTYGVSGFKQTVTEFGRVSVSRTTLANTKNSPVVFSGTNDNPTTNTLIAAGIKYLVYTIYDMDATNRENYTMILKHAILQSDTASNFGTYTDSLTEGNYAIVVSGLVEAPPSPFNFEDVYTHNFGGPYYSPLTLSLSKYNTNESFRWEYSSNLYLSKYQQFTISEGVNTDLQNINLQNTTGELEIKVLDDTTDTDLSISANVGSFNYCYLEFYNKTMSFGSNNIDSSYFTKINKGDFLAKVLVGYDSVPNVMVTLTAEKGNIKYNKTINNVTYYPGKKTILTGKLFDNPNYPPGTGGVGGSVGIVQQSTDSSVINF